MTPAPKRRWLQFQLSTVFILIAIVAWAMALRPYYTNGRLFMSLVDPKVAAQGMQQSPTSGQMDVNNWGLPISEWKDSQRNRPQIGFDNYDIRVWYWRARLTLERLAWPAVALAALFAWKATRAVIKGRLARRLPPVP